ncbi:MAG: hypothetical protein QM703_15195 [Gemmatales bacterium]
MTVLLQHPDKTKESPASKSAGEIKQPPAKTEEKTAPSKEASAKTGQETLPPKDAVPPAEAKLPDSPIQPPPGANLPGKVQEQPKAAPPLGSILQPALLLIGILVVGAILIAWLKKSRDRSKGAVALSAHDQLSAFRDSVDEGDMTDEEFKKVKALLAEKIRKPANPVTTTPGSAEPPSPNEKPPA